MTTKTDFETHGTRTGRFSKKKLTTRCFAGRTELERVAPLSDKVLLKRVEPLMTAGGIALSADHDNAMNPDRKTLNCMVLAVGPGKLSEDGETRIPMTAEVGDEAVVDLFGVTDVSIDRTPLFVAEEKNILAVIR